MQIAGLKFVEDSDRIALDLAADRRGESGVLCHDLVRVLALTRIV